MEPKKIRKMCRLAMFEQDEERKALAVAGYYRRDYVALGLLSNFLQITIVYFILALALIVMNVDFLIDNFYRIDFYKVAAIAITAYALLLGLYSVLVFTLRRLHYARSKRKVRRHYIALNRLLEMEEEAAAVPREDSEEQDG